MTGTVAMRLTASFDQQRREIGDLWLVPTGAKVLLNIRDTTLFDPYVREELRKHADRLDIDVQGNVNAVRECLALIRGVEL